MTGYLVRPATEADLDALVGFEIEIAIVSFADEAITDPALHRKRVSRALGQPGEVTLAAAAEEAPDVPLGWAWLSPRTNSLTGDQYGNFRSLAVADVPDRAAIGDLLMAAVLAAAGEAGMTQLTGKVHAGNLGMRALYRKFGFTATHLTMERRAADGGSTVIKCVVWDIDNTLLDGVYLESAGQPPPADPALTAVLRELSGRGILHALASRNPPEAADYVQAATGAQFAAARCGWDSKAESVRAIAAELDLATDTLAFVDDDMIERAEVAAALPEVLVLTPEDAGQAPQWPDFSPPVLTAEGRRRAGMYAARQRRQAEAATFGGSREDFLRHAGTQITIGRAGPADIPRLHELSVRTRQLNSGAAALSEDDLAALVSSPGYLVPVVSLRDDYGDDGMVGAAALARNGAGSWPVPVLMMSCRALGRGVLEALLGWLSRTAAAAGATGLTVPCLVTDRNVPLRLALAAAGLRAAPGSAAAGERAEFSRSLTGPLPPVPDWLTGWDGTP